MSDPGTLVWKIHDIEDEVLGELIVAWSAEERDNDWYRKLTVWRIAPRLPNDFVLVKQAVRDDQRILGDTAWERRAAAIEIWNEFLLSNSAMTGSTAAEFNGNIRPIPEQAE